MKSYVKIILVVVVFALWIMFNQLSSSKVPAASGGCGCGGGSCSVTPPAGSSK